MNSPRKIEKISISGLLGFDGPIGMAAFSKTVKIGVSFF